MKNTCGRLLIVDDNEDLLLALKLMLQEYFTEIDTLTGPKTLHTALNQHSYDIILLDMNFTGGVMTGNEGIFWLREILKKDKDAIVIMITAYGDIELAVKAVREGATDFIHKSWDEDKILSTILSACKLRKSKMKIRELETRNARLGQSQFANEEVYTFPSAAMQRVYELVHKVAATDANVLLLGENGTGKEIIARMIHRHSQRSNQIFVKVDLGAIHENLLESELFGHVKGAFTDAKTDREGRFEMAGGGTLFLDEIGNLPLPSQTKLLSVLQNREVTPLGSNTPRPVDVRLISATNSPVYDRVEENKFREDLLYRINTIQIDIPPLRERPEDIPGLADYFLKQFAAKYDRQITGIARPAEEKLRKFHWPGNIRELQHTIEKAVILADSEVLKASDILHGKQIRPPRQKGSFNLEENEKRIIEEALEKFRGNVSLTAEKLGINRTTLYAKMRKYEIQ